MPHPVRIPPVLAGMVGGLIVSCQARADNPLHGPVFMAAMARAAEAGGALGLRMNGPDDIGSARRAVTIPIIGVFKQRYEGYAVEITPTFDEAAAIASAGAAMIALDGTARPRPDGTSLEALIARIHTELGLPVLADCAGIEDGIAAVIAGADAVATTLSGYLDPAVPPSDEPDLHLLSALAGRLEVPVIAEGRIRTPAQARAALGCGAYAVVVGTAITNPREITRWYVREMTA